MDRRARAKVEGIRQRTQYTCMSASMCMALRALGIDCEEDEVNKVMGARPRRGATWENALACGQHYGMRCTLTTPCTISQLRKWTDAGTPVMIAWNPEGRPWSHASLVFDVEEDGTVHVADPNIPDPDETVRVVPKSEFYKQWYEKWPDYLVRRPAMAVEREISSSGRQVMASYRMAVAASRGTETREAFDDYVQAVTDLEVSADLVVVATNKLRSLGFHPDAGQEDYPFAEDIEVVANDIGRWRGELDRRDVRMREKTASRVARRYLRSKEQ